MPRCHANGSSNAAVASTSDLAEIDASSDGDLADADSQALEYAVYTAYADARSSAGVRRRASSLSSSAVRLQAQVSAPQMGEDIDPLCATPSSPNPRVRKCGLAQVCVGREHCHRHPACVPMLSWLQIRVQDMQEAVWALPAPPMHAKAPTPIRTRSHNRTRKQRMAMRAHIRVLQASQDR